MKKFKVAYFLKTFLGVGYLSFPNWNFLFILLRHSSQTLPKYNQHLSIIIADTFFCVGTAYILTKLLQQNHYFKNI